MVTVIIGVGVVSVMQLLTAGTMANGDSVALTTAVNLANNVHEASMRRDYDDLFGLEGTHSPPVDAMLNDIGSLSGWEQVVDVSYVNPNMITAAVPDSQVEPTTRIRVTVRRNGKEIYTTSWLMTADE